MVIKRKYPEGTGAVTIGEAARILGISECNLRRRVKDGNVQAFRLGKLIRVSKKTLERIMEGDNGKDGVSEQE